MSDPYDLAPSTVEGMAESCLRAVAAYGDHVPLSAAVMPSHQFISNLCLRVIQLERMLDEVPMMVAGAVAAALAEQRTSWRNAPASEQ